MFLAQETLNKVWGLLNVIYCISFKERSLESEQYASHPNTRAALPSSDADRALIHKLASSALVEQRRSRRWSIFFKSLGFLYLFVLLGIFLASRDSGELTAAASGKHTAVIEVSGPIAADQDASADRIISGLTQALEDEDTAGVILRVNSPGGSPVQAGIIFDELKRLRSEYPDIPIYTVIGDLGTSGAYYIAAATDRIYANKASIVGSIGVVMGGFGFVEGMQKLGIERRLLTSGDRKALLDPFSPADEASVTHLQAMLDQIHQQFIEVVKQGRGERLADDPDLYSGLVWTGEQGVQNGLVDELRNARYVAREVIGAERLVDFSFRDDFLTQLGDQLSLGLRRALSFSR